MVRASAYEQPNGASHEALHIVWQLSKDGLVMLDHQSLMTAVNPAVQHLFGYTQSELIGQPLSLLLPQHSELCFPLADDDHVLALHKEQRAIAVQVEVRQLSPRSMSVVILRDVSERLLRQQAQTLAQQLQQLGKTLETEFAKVQWQAIDAVSAPEKSRQQKRIIIADEHPISRCGLIALINAEPDLQVCAEADSVHAAQRLVQTMQPDAVLMSLNLSLGNGLQLIHNLHAQGVKLPLLVISMYEESFFAERVLRAGANGYICKRQPLETILYAIRQVLRGRLYVGGDVAEHLLRSQLQNGTLRQTKSEERLSDRELEVYMMIGRGYSTKRIADELHLSTKTVDSHKEHIREKLGIGDNLALVRRAMTWMLDNENNGEQP